MKTITRRLLPLAVACLELPAVAQAWEQESALDAEHAAEAAQFTRQPTEASQQAGYSADRTSLRGIVGSSDEGVAVGVSTEAVRVSESVGNLRLAQANDADDGAPSTAGRRAARTAETRGTLEEIIVTAQKREERLQEVPVSITAITGERLDALQVNSLSDLAGYVPGMSVLSSGRPGNREIVLRGLSTGGTATTPSMVGTYVDDIPLGSSGAAGRPGIWGLDLMPYDFAGVEVLKGPQGTLYGANSMGGLLKYTLRKPSLSDFEARLGSSIESVDYSDDDPTWGARAMVSVPVVDGKLGMRASGFYRDTAGYTDNESTGEADVDTSRQKGGLALILWQPTNDIAVRGTAMAQNVDAANQSFVSVIPGTLQPQYGRYIYASPIATPTESETSLYGIGVDWDLSFGTITSSTSLSELRLEYSDDLTAFFGPLCAAFCPDYPFEDALARFDGMIETKRFTQEVRLTSKEERKVQWMVGGYYSYEDVLETQSLPALTSSGDRLPERNNLFTIETDKHYDEMAAFVNGRYKFTEQFDVGAGVRYSTYELRNKFSPIGGPFGSGTTAATIKLSPQNVTTWMVDARYFLPSGVMLYGRVATGYRPGDRAAGVPAIGYSGIVDPDHTKNYELGLKGELLERRVGFDFSVFSVDWTDIQLQQRVSGISFPGNGGTARSRGVELSTTYLPIQSLQVMAGVAYTDAQLTENAPGVAGLDGDQLPGSPKWAGSLTLDYTQSLGHETTLRLGSGYRYRGEIPTAFGVSRMQLDSQETIDAYVGLSIEAADIRLYVKNAFNDFSYVNGNGPLLIAAAPRTFILTLDYSF